MVFCICKTVGVCREVFRFDCWSQLCACVVLFFKRVLLYRICDMDAVLIIAEASFTSYIYIYIYVYREGDIWGEG